MPAYAALSLDAGRLEVAWQLDGDIFTMSWTVREGPSVSAPKTHGFGTTVIERMAESSLVHRFRNSNHIKPPYRA
jgi:two-component sensor histidine kinase